MKNNDGRDYNDSGNDNKDYDDDDIDYDGKDDDVGDDDNDDVDDEDADYDDNGKDDDVDDNDNGNDNTCWHICHCPELTHGLAFPVPLWDGELLGTWSSVLVLVDYQHPWAILFFSSWDQYTQYFNMMQYMYHESWFTISKLADIEIFATKMPYHIYMLLTARMLYFIFHDKNAVFEVSSMFSTLSLVLPATS